MKMIFAHLGCVLVAILALVYQLPVDASFQHARSSTIKGSTISRKRSALWKAIVRTRSSRREDASSLHRPMASLDSVSSGQIASIARNRDDMPSGDAATSLCVSSSCDSDVMNSLSRLRGGSTTDWRFFVAGGLCAALSHGATTPIDVVKTTIQADPERFYGKGLVDAALDIIRRNGALFLLAGLGPTLVGYGVEGALKFGSYETLKGVFKSLTPNQAVNYIIASLLAGVIASVALCPLEDARIKMVADPAFADLNTISAVALAVRRDGPMSLFNGLGALLMKQIPYTSVKQVSFDLIAKALYSLSAKLPAGSTAASVVAGNSGLIVFMSAFLTSILSCLASQPGDMVLTAMCQNSHAHSVHIPSVDRCGACDTSSSTTSARASACGTAINIYRSRGIAGFFIGTQARLLHVVAIVTSQLIIYDAVKRLLGLAATGSH